MRPVVTVHTDTRGFRDFERKLSRAAFDALAATGRHMEGEAQHNPSRYDIDHITGASHASRPFKTYRGAAVEVVNTDSRSLFFELGTYRKGKGKRAAGNAGVKPVRFLRRALRSGRLELIGELKRRLP